jgi:predicted O-methyltransferase YrrM/heme-degrading monooxygenase HmoA
MFEVVNKQKRGLRAAILSEFVGKASADKSRRSRDNGEAVLCGLMFCRVSHMSLSMFIAMNRFQVKAASADAFENVWRERESYLGQVPGFIRFHLLRASSVGQRAPASGPESVEFISHSTWLTESAFLGWLDSDASRKAHSGASGTREMLIGPPEFRFYRVALDQVAGDRTDFRSAYLDQLVEKTFSQESDAQIELKRWAESESLPPIRIGAFEGRLLECLLRASGARRGLEIGTLGGYSASWLLRALPEDGHLISLELDPQRAQRAQDKLNELGLGSRIEVLHGDAKRVLNENLKDLRDLDFVFIDADKGSYPDYIDWAVPRLRKGALLIADNAYIWGAMNHFGADAESLPKGVHKGLHEYSRSQFEGMSSAWKKLAYHPELASVILPTGEGLGLAVKI